MQTLVKITEKAVIGLLPVDYITWDWDRDDNGREFAFYNNPEHEFEFEEVLLRFDLSLKTHEGDERNDVFIGHIKECWIGEELVELSYEEEKSLIEVLTKHYENPFNIE